jgi:hypothetical protein
LHLTTGQCTLGRVGRLPGEPDPGLAVVPRTDAVELRGLPRRAGRQSVARPPRWTRPEVRYWPFGPPRRAQSLATPLTYPAHLRSLARPETQRHRLHRTPASWAHSKGTDR